MALSSVMSVGLSGMSAAELTIDAVGNNLANLNTTAYKQSFPRFATQTPATHSLGQPPDGAAGGSNPVQTGRGVQAAEMAVDSSSGSLVATNTPTDLAVQGDGFFVLQTAQGQRAYTRNGQFKINGQQRLVTADGDFVMGFGVDENGNVVEGPLVPLEIPAADARDSNGNAVRLMSFSVAGDGRIVGRYSDGLSRTLGKVSLARFANSNGLVAAGETTYTEGPNSGPAAIASRSEPGASRVAGGFRELSNTDLGENLIQLLLARNQFRANLQVVDTASELLESLVDLQRR